MDYKVTDVGDRRTALQRCPVLTPEAWETMRLHGKGDLELQTEIR